MNELILIDMMSELNPELLQNNYIEKDMKRGKIPFYRLIFSSKKASKQCISFPVENPVSYESPASDRDNDELEVTEDIKTAEVTDKTEKSKEEGNEWGFDISIFEKKFRNLFKIISGIAATVIVVVSIIIIIIRRHKSGIKLHSKKIQIIY